MELKQQRKLFYNRDIDLLGAEQRDFVTSLDLLKTDALVAIVESLEHAPDLRLAAGEMLAKRGDPRISIDSPSMVSIPGAVVRVGIKDEEVETIFQECRSFGVTREVVELEAPEHSVELSPFSIGKYCVTNEEFHAFVVETDCHHRPTSWKDRRYEAAKSNHPVFSVSEEAAVDYCSWLSRRTKRRFRLPTEAEWEYASSGNEHFKFPWGNTFEPDRANTIEEQMLSTTPIGMFARGHSPFGVMDMAGNVEEYTSSEYVNYAGESLPENSFLKNLERAKVTRGGSFARFHDLTRNTCRHAVGHPDKYVIGFRLVEDQPLH